MQAMKKTYETYEGGSEKHFFLFDLNNCINLLSCNTIDRYSLRTKCPYNTSI